MENRGKKKKIKKCMFFREIWKKQENSKISGFFEKFHKIKFKAN